MKMMQQLTRRHIALTSAVALLGLAGQAQSAIKTFNGPTTTAMSWATPGNWIGGTVPTGSDVAAFEQSAATAVSTTAGARLVSLDSSQTAYAISNSVSNQAATTPTLGTVSLRSTSTGFNSAITLTLLSTDTVTGTGTNVAVYNSSIGSTSLDAPIVLGNAANASPQTATFQSARSGTGASGALSINGGISAFPGSTWNVRFVGTSTGNLIQTTAAAQPFTYNGDTIIENLTGFQFRTANLAPNGAGKGNLVLNGTGRFILPTGANQTINGLVSTSSTSSVSVSATLTVGANDTTSTFAGKTDGTGANSQILKTGTGTLTLTGALAHSGNTTINGGRLLVNGTHIASSPTASVANNYIINSSGTLGGTGTITLGLPSAGTGATSITANSGGAIAPGASIGTLNVVSNLASDIGVVFNPGGIFDVETGATSSDLLNITGVQGNISMTSSTDVLNLTSTSRGTFTVASFTGSLNGYFDIVKINNMTLDGTFSPAGAGGTWTATGDPDFKVIYTASAGATPGTIVVAVPEPASLGLIALGATTVLTRRRRKYS